MANGEKEGGVTWVAWWSFHVIREGHREELLLVVERLVMIKTETIMTRMIS